MNTEVYEIKIRFLLLNGPNGEEQMPECRCCLRYIVIDYTFSSTNEEAEWVKARLVSFLKASVNLILHPKGQDRKHAWSCK